MISKEKNKIPKIIHYCWFGGNPLPDDVKKYIESWKKYCPEYKIKEWNETNFDINFNDYVKEAYQAKKWAFVSDIARIVALYNEGGIYLDTDVEVLKSFNDFLNNNSFFGFESDKAISTAIMGAEKHFFVFKEFLNYYKNKHFIKEDGTYDLTTNVVVLTNIFCKHNIVFNNKTQNIDNIYLYSSEYFSPKDFETGDIKITNNTYTIHNYSESWHSNNDKKLIALRRKVNKIFGKKIGKYIYKILYFFYRIKFKIQEIGFWKTILYVFKKNKKKKNNGGSNE